MAAQTFTIDDRLISAEAGSTVLEAARQAGIRIPTLCHLEGLDDVGACRLCLVEIEGSPRLVPACATRVTEGLRIRTATERLHSYRRMILELLFAERNHVCAACVSNGHCELQALAWQHGIDHVRYEYQCPALEVDLSHPQFGMDHNRCILCTRCVRACRDIEGAGTRDVAGRGTNCRIITDLNQPWGESESCTACGKCVESCPTGALFHRGSTAAEMRHDAGRIARLVSARERKPWTA